jgi:hypothetical protein
MAGALGPCRQPAALQGRGLLIRAHAHVDRYALGFGYCVVSPFSPNQASNILYIRGCVNLPFERAGFTGVLQPDCTRDLWIGLRAVLVRPQRGLSGSASGLGYGKAHDVIGRNVGLSKNTVMEIVTCETTARGSPRSHVSRTRGS